MTEEIKHYGTPRHSGRYPWGSGDDPQQRNRSFLGQVEELSKKGMSEVDIAKGLGMTTSQLRAKKSIAKAEQRKEDVAQALKLKDKGYSNVAIGEKMGLNESSVRALLDPVLHERSNITSTTANMLRESVQNKGYIDVGVGVERYMGISRTKLKTAIAQLEEEGYMVSWVPVRQVGTGKNTTTLVLSKPSKQDAVEVIKLRNMGMTNKEIAKKIKLSETAVTSLVKESFSEVFSNKDNIKMITDYSEDGGRSFLGLEPVKSVDSKRVHIRYAEDGGKDKDGVIELRRGVDDISLGKSRYAQVRIGVDGTHYLKGMAIYSDDMPKGVDIIYNTNKHKDVPKEKVFKSMERDKDGNIDQDNPFGASVRQKHYIDKNGKKELSALNIVGLKEGTGEEGAWESWSRTLSSQVLSKQAPSLVKKQLDLAYDAKKKEYDEIMSLTNSVVRKKLLKSFSDNCDSAAVHLKGAAMPRQMSHVILPLPKLKETEIYAPNYENGEKVVLIRHPHGGIFEIPELTVNNRNPSGRNLLGNIKDAVGINPKVAEQLSGADFDGDTVLVIPNPAKGGIRTSAPLKGLKDFDPKERYPYRPGMKVMGEPGGGNTGQKMGDISNLITDMTIKGANTDEICRAVRHSMVVIDAEKHKLDYTKSYIDNGIASLKQKYQGGANRGASTLISRASSDKRVPYREDGKKVLDPETGKTKRVYIDPKTGKKLYEYTGETYTNKDGKTVVRTIKSTKMAETDDAFTLSSGTPVETIYAQHANKLKTLGNQARKDYLKVEKFEYSASAKEAYAPEVASLNSKLNIALKNAPLERHAQLIANTIIKAKINDNPGMTNDEIKKISNQALAAARASLKAKKEPIPITDKEWEAIQAHAISSNTLTKIIDNAKPEDIKRLATPRVSKTLSPSQLAKANVLLKAGNTKAEVAKALGVSVNVLSKSVN